MNNDAPIPLKFKLAFLLACAMSLAGCTALARAQAVSGIADASGAVGCIAEAAGEPWGAPLCRAAEWLARHAAKRVDALTPEVASVADVELDAAAEQLQQALDLCDPEPTQEQVDAVVAALEAAPQVKP
jgi:hypothetical protein